MEKESDTESVPIPHPQSGFGFSDQTGAIDENYAGLIAKGNNNLIELIDSVNGAILGSVITCSKIKKVKFSDLHENIIFFLGHNGQISCLNTENSEISLLFKNEMVSDFDTISTPLDGGTIIVAACFNEVIAIDQNSSTILWRRKLPKADVNILEISIDKFVKTRLLIRTNECWWKMIGFGAAKPTKQMTKISLAKTFDHLQPDDGNAADLSGVIQSGFLNSVKNACYMLFKRILIVCDISTLDVLLRHELEKSSSSYMALCSTTFRQLIYLVHESGYISVRACQKFGETTKYFRLVCVSDKFRTTTWSKCRGITLNRKFETLLHIYFTDGKIVKFKLEGLESTDNDKNLLYGNYSTTSKFLPEVLAPADMIDKDLTCYSQIKFKLRQTAQFGKSIDSTYNVIKSNPPLTLKNLQYWKPMVVIANNKGVVQIINVSENTTVGEYLVHTTEIKIIKWLDQNNILTLSVSVGTNQKVTNEVSKLNLVSGRVVVIRKSKALEDEISGIVPSLTGRFLFVNFKYSQSPEFWLLEGQPKLLRRFRKADIPDLFRHVTWFSKAENMEKFFFYDNMNSLRIIQCYETKLKEVGLIPLRKHSHAITSSAFKKQTILTGFQDGTIEQVLVDDTNESRIFQITHNPIISMTFAPGKGNYFVLIETKKEYIIWDAHEGCIFQKRQKDQIMSADWISSDRIIVLDKIDRSLKILSLNLEAEPIQLQKIPRANNTVLKALEVLSESNDVFLVLQKLQDLFLDENEKHDFLFVMVVTSFLSNNSHLLDTWLMEHLCENERIKQSLKNKIGRLKFMSNQMLDTNVKEKILRRWAQLCIIFGFSNLPLEFLLSSAGDNFSEDSLRGLVLVMLRDNTENKQLVRHHIKMISATFLSKNQLLDAVEYLTMVDCVEDAIKQLVEQEQYQLARLICAAHDCPNNFQMNSRWTKKMILNGDYETAAFFNLFIKEYDTFFDLCLASNQLLRILIVAKCIQPAIDEKTKLLINEKLSILYGKDQINEGIRLFV